MSRPLVLRVDAGGREEMMSAALYRTGERVISMRLDTSYDEARQTGMEVAWLHDNGQILRKYSIPTKMLLG